MSDDKKLNKVENQSQNHLIATTQGNSESTIPNKKEISNNRLLAKQIMTHKCTQFFIIFLVAIYTILIFTVVAIDDLLESEDKENSLNVLLYVEISILVLFVLEISLTAYGQGFKFYFRDGWLVFDAIVILVSMVFVIIDLTISFGDQLKVISSMIRGIFRFVRIFLLIRKLQTFKKIKTSGSIKTAAEKIMETLGEIKDLIEITEILQDIDWAMEMIGSNKLYDPVYNRKGDENDEWFNQYNQQDNMQENQNGQDSSKKQRRNPNAIKVNPRSDKILATIPNKALQMFEKIKDIDFNCFELYKITKGQELSYLLIYLFETNDLYTELDINHKVLKNFALAIQNGYKNNPYHNSLHAFDVTQTVNFFLQKMKFQDIAQITDLELCTIFLSSAFHDFEHPGLNNPYHIATQGEFALRYNDISVLENHHVSAAFQLMQNEELDVAQNFSTEDYKKFREMSISIVLGTDMSKHFTDIAKIKGRLGQEDFEVAGKDKLMCIDSVVHAADISNPIKPFEVCYQWTEKVMEEFWNQGDKERELNLPITYLCDRYTTNMPKSQGGFIDFVVRPLYEVIGNFLPDLIPVMQNFDDNKKQWATKVDEYEKILQKMQQEREQQSQDNLK